MDVREIMLLVEGKRIGTAVRLDEIPIQYKHLKVLGRGATSVILEKDPATVLVFTRDAMKAEYLIHNHIATYVDEYTRHGHHIRGMSEIPITVLQMPRLAPLTQENKRKVKQLIGEFIEVRRRMGVERFGIRPHEKERAIQDLLNHYNDRDEHLLSPVCYWLMNCSTGQYRFDLHPANFMQNAEGQIVVLDPVVSEEIMDLIQNGQKQRANARREASRYGGYRHV